VTTADHTAGQLTIVETTAPPGLARCPLHRRQPTWPGLQADPLPDAADEMRNDSREFIRKLEAVGLMVEPTPGHYRVLR
jgi:hypothetical protein